ncbi:MAG TPA: hypothetical protein VNM72_15185, partial [Blastocatellia bacterium]|nr:hypothetical protein [Blastocatellia bacterium]
MSDGNKQSHTREQALAEVHGKPEAEESASGAQASSPSDDFRLNYFNYFTEVEEHFVRRRGKHLLVSTLDWAI